MEAIPHMHDALVRIQIEYVHMPQLTLTSRQAQRLWSLSAEVCEAAFAALLDRGFLLQRGRCLQENPPIAPLDASC